MVFGGNLNGLYKSYSSFLERLYSNTATIRCPFFKRRAADFIDNLFLITTWVLARHKSINPPPGCKSFGDSKVSGLNLLELCNIIEDDWAGQYSSGKGYYITGKLTKEIYQDDCFFDGPDPDMPVRGLRKYLAASSKLFDQKKSRADLISINFEEGRKIITVCWRLEGVLNLPWHPALKPWTGSTKYYVDDTCLIFKHEESWDIPVLDAFLSTLFPKIYVGTPPAPPVSHRK
jgi:hypothetical protein